MSRVGKNPVKVPDGVQVAVDGQTVTAKGKFGEQRLVVTPELEVVKDGAQVWVRPRASVGRTRPLWGTYRSRLNNLVNGVASGFTRSLAISGVGFRAAVQGQTLTLQLGYSHDVVYPIPEGVTITCATPQTITVVGADRQRVGQAAAEIRALRKPEPYKGKGIRYADEVILRKEGKKK